MRAHALVRPCTVFALVVAAGFPAAPAAGQQEQQQQNKAWEPFVERASDEGEMALGQFSLPPGFKADLFAAEPRLANPVAFHVDEHNRFYVVETFRRKKDVVDIRGVMHWLDDDTASRTVAMRNAMVKKFLPPEEVADMTKASERIRLIEDRDRDGKADHDTVFATGFNRLEDGIAAGVLPHGGDVWFANVPSLWRLRDTNSDGIADRRDELQYGYGVRYNFNGHDLHGLRFGPDGKLYFSMGDRGLHVEKTPEGRVVSYPDGGAVLRCNPDGTELELFHTGLRNPQELAFDEFGNLFTGDNNCDAGDKARWVYVVEGGETGWRTGYQSHEFPVSRGPWMHEGLWQSKPPYPTFYVLPPVVELESSGPSGLTVDPGGAGLPPEFAGRFFMADFRGGPALSSVVALKHRPKGAGFEMVEQKPVVGNLLATDVEFGYDGLYISDWTNGWVTTGKGRLYRVFHEQGIKDPIVAETRKLMGEGMAKRPAEELAKLLGHADQRVRQAAQFELAKRGVDSAPVFERAARQKENRLARFHGVWGLGQLARKSADVLKSVLPLLADEDDEVRTQAAKVLGDARYGPAFDGLLAALGDKSARVKFYAAIGLGKLGRKEAMGGVAQLLRDNADRDPYLRHACVMAFSMIGSPAGLANMNVDSDPSLRMGALLALRRLQSPLIATYLNDRDPNLVLEAARAINDVPIEPAMRKLADLIERGNLQEPVLTRVLNANYRAGTPMAAALLARFANDSTAPERYRVEALRLLGTWENVPGRDLITGNWRAIPPRDPKIARDAAAPVLPEILRTAPDAVRVTAAELVTKLGVTDPALLAELVADAKLGASVRAAALTALAGTGDTRLAPAVDLAMTDKDVTVRAAGVQALAKLPDGVKHLAAILDGDRAGNGRAHPVTAREQQAALAALATVPGEDADRLIGGLLEHMLAGSANGREVSAEIRLDVLEAAAARKSLAVVEKLKQYESKRDANDPLAPFVETLHGGDPALGGRIFRERTDVSCMRCHSIQRKGGNAGPDLAGTGTRLSREQILESIVQPSKTIAQGFETVAVRLKDGTTYAGQVKSEDDKILRLVDPGKSDVRIDKSQIKSRRGGMSSMPDNVVQTLSKQDLRNLVEFLAGLTDPLKERQKRPDRQKPAGTVVHPAGDAEQ